MTEEKMLLIDESIQMELNVAELYRVFHDAFPDDAVFWWALHREEKSHAALIRSAKDSFAKRGSFPYELIGDSLEQLIHANVELEKLISGYLKTPPTRREAFCRALEFEGFSGEHRYNAFMGKDPESRIESVFQQLNMDDNDHVARITAYMKEQGLWKDPACGVA